MPGEPGLRPTTPAGESAGRRLDSWKEIASYLNRHVTTVRRWERFEALPVHRHLHAKLGSIYAFSKELDAWMESRRLDGAPPEPAPAGPPPLTGRLHAPPSISAAPPTFALCGRDEEMRTLQRSWDLACEGQRQLVVISGEPGVGKTRLALDFARTVSRRGSVLVGRCDREALVPFAPLITILQWLLRAIPDPALRDRLARLEGSGELAHMVPEIASRVCLPEELVQATPEGRRFRMFEACSELLVATSRGAPVLLLVEDVHWADHGTLLFLRHLVRSTRGAPVCILLTCRPRDPESAASTREILEDLRREQCAVPVALGPLSATQVRRLIELRVGPEPPSWLTTFALRHAEGNPLYLTELLQHLDETGALQRLDHTPAEIGVADVGLPVRVRELIERRLSRLSAEARRVLTTAAVVGREFTLSPVETVVGLDEDATLDAMDEALAAGIVSEEPGAPGSFAFTHPLIRETLYVGATGARRIRLHHRLALALEREGASDRLGELAYHFGQAAAYRDADKAVEYAARAGDEAAARLGLEDAARYYEMALRAMERLPAGSAGGERRIDLLVRRGRCFFQVGQWAAAKAAFDAATSLIEPSAAARRAELLVGLAEASFWLMDVASLRRYAAEAEALADQAGRGDLWADAQAWAASAAVAEGDVLGGVEADRRTLARCGGIQSFGLARVPLTLYWAGCGPEAAERATQAVERARLSDDPAFLLYALQHLGLSLSGVGRYDEAFRAFDEARAFGRRCGAFPLLARATSMSVAPLLGIGALAAAKTRALEARELAHRVAFEPPLVSAGIDLLLVHARSNDPGPAGGLLEETERAVRKAAGWHAWKWSMRLSQAKAELAAARGDWATAIRESSQVIEQSRARHRSKYEALALSVRARAVHRAGLVRAVEDARAAARVARALDDPAVLLECLATLLEVDGDDSILAEARRTARRILGALPDAAMRQAFTASVAARSGAVLLPAAPQP